MHPPKHRNVYKLENAHSKHTRTSSTALLLTPASSPHSMKPASSICAIFSFMLFVGLTGLSLLFESSFPGLIIRLLSDDEFLRMLLLLCRRHCCLKLAIFFLYISTLGVRCSPQFTRAIKIPLRLGSGSEGDSCGRLLPSLFFVFFPQHDDGVMGFEP